MYDHNLRYTVAAALCCVLAACGPEPPAGLAADDHEDEAPAPTNRVAIPPTVRKNLGITFARVEARRVASTARIPGAFELKPRARREFRLPLPGYVELHVDQYDEVEPGQLLFRFRSPEWPELLHEIVEGEQAIATAEAGIGVAEARLEEARSGLERVRERVAALASAAVKRADLEADRAALEASLPRLEAERVAAETSLTNAHRTHEHALHRAAAAAGVPEEELVRVRDVDGAALPAYATLEWIEVRASSAGTVELLAVTDGTYVEAPELVLATVDPTRVRFRAVALQADLALYANGGPARIVPPPSLSDAGASGVAATLRVGLEAHPDERTIDVLAEPGQRAAWVRPGVSAYLEVTTDASAPRVLAIPEAAVVQDGLVHVFFRRAADDPAQAVRVEADLGARDGRWVEVLSGLQRGDEVVLDGAYELKLATETGGATPRGGHFHADGSFHAGDH